MDNKVKFIIIARFPVENNEEDSDKTHIMKYIIYNFKNKTVHLLTENAMEKASDYILNMEYNNYVQLLTPVCFCYPKRTIYKPKLNDDSIKVFKTGKIIVEVLEHFIFGEKCVEIKIHNTGPIKSNKKIKPEKEIISTERINTDYNKRKLYNDVLMIKEYITETSTLSIKLFNIYGVSNEKIGNSSENELSNVLYKRELVKTVANNKDINNVIAKAKAIGINEVDVSCIEDDKNIILLSDNPKRIYLNANANKYGFDYTLDIVSSSIKEKLEFTESQLESIKYNTFIVDLNHTYKENGEINPYVCSCKVLKGLINDGLITIK